MTRSVFSGALLLATLFLGALRLSAQEPAGNDDLPEAPRPAVTSPVPSSRAAQEGSIGQGQKSSHAGFPPVSSSTPGRSPVPEGSRRNIPGQPATCQPDSSSPAQRVMSCQPNIPMFSRFLDSSAPQPLTPRQKFTLARKDVTDPFNFLTIAVVSAYSIAANSHTHYGPGFPGFAKNAGVSLTQDMTAEFFGTFLIPSLAHQDPRYHRMPNLPLTRRIIHVVDEVVIAQSDEGAPMFNYATVFGTIGTQALGNLYVPGRNHSWATSIARISTSLATDPIGNVITEFLPDVARRVNVQVVFVQRLINRIAIAEGSPPQ